MRSHNMMNQEFIFSLLSFQFLGHFYVIMFSQNGQTFLMIASQKGEADVVRHLLTQPNVDIDGVDNVSVLCLTNP